MAITMVTLPMTYRTMRPAAWPSSWGQKRPELSGRCDCVRLWCRGPYLVSPMAADDHLRQQREPQDDPPHHLEHNTAVRQQPSSGPRTFHWKAAGFVSVPSDSGEEAKTPSRVFNCHYDVTSRAFWILLFNYFYRPGHP